MSLILSDEEIELVDKKVLERLKKLDVKNETEFSWNVKRGNIRDEELTLAQAVKLLAEGLEINKKYKYSHSITKADAYEKLFERLRHDIEQGEGR